MVYAEHLFIYLFNSSYRQQVTQVKQHKDKSSAPTTLDTAGIYHLHGAKIQITITSFLYKIPVSTQFLRALYGGVLGVGDFKYAL